MDYKDKLRLAKEALDSGSYDKETIEYIFPELKESEDMKIKRDIQYAVRCAYGDNSDNTNIIFAWLEKQGLQKQRKEWNADDVWNHNQIMDILQEYNRTELMDWLEKQFEQNPIEWSEEDEKMCEKLLFLMEEENSISSWEGCYEWLNSLMRRMKGE